jgi:glycosyltransferase involved in cell wall biosynthesis
MSYIIIGDLFTFPDGEAATNRVHTYAKGLSVNGREVHVICLRNDYLPDFDGVTDGIKYYRPFGQSVRSRYFPVRNWKKVMKFIRTFRLVRGINRKGKIQAIIVYTGLPFTFLFAWFVAAATRSKLVQEVSEHPMRYYQEGKMKIAMGKLSVRLQTTLNDGIFCISHFLMDFYRQKGFPPGRLLLVPSTVDPERFTSLTGTPFSFPYVGYFGMLTFSRDRLDILIEAFAGIAAKYPEYRLVLGGPVYGSELEKIKALASELGITDRTIILDYMPREEIIRYIVNSDVLVMVRGNDIKAHASFPSKLTEYLATSKPVISVNVGEISRFLTDGVNAYLVEPGNSIQLAEKIDLVLSDYPSALVTAGKGRQLAETIFNYDYQAKRIIPFVESLQTSQN